MKLEVVILAAGQGKRMKSRLPKVLHVVGGMPLLEHVIRTAQGLEPRAIHVVIGHGSEQVQDALAHYDINWVVQERQAGTGHAVLQVIYIAKPGATGSNSTRAVDRRTAEPPRLWQDTSR